MATGRFKKGIRVSPKTEFVKGFSPWNKGKIGVQKSTRKGVKQKPHSEAAKEKMRLSQTGHSRSGWKLSDATRTKISISNKGKTRKGHVVWNKGIPSKMTGNKNFNWKGGISKIDKLCRCMSEYKQWRSDCFSRDNWTCQTCQNKGFVTVHHIKGLNKIVREFNLKSVSDARNCIELWDLENGVTLCEDCHKLTDNYKGRAKNNNKKLS